MSGAGLFLQDGFVVLPGLLNAGECSELLGQLPGVDGPGSRTMLEQGWCAELAARLLRSEALGSIMPAGHVAVQCTFFEKSDSVNWLVPVHQDLSIPVLERCAFEGAGGWSLKEDGWYVQPPVAVLEQLVAVRVHLDACGAEDGPLYVVPGSHRLGVIPSAAVAAMRGGERVCLAAAGDALVMRPLLLHRSSKSTGVSRRRVLHFLFGPASLPGGLEWRVREGACHETHHRFN